MPLGLRGSLGSFAALFFGVLGIAKVFVNGIIVGLFGMLLWL